MKLNEDTAEGITLPGIVKPNSEKNFPLYTGLMEHIPCGHSEHCSDGKRIQVNLLIGDTSQSTASHMTDIILKVTDPFCHVRTF